MSYRPEELVRFVVKQNDPAFTRAGYAEFAERSKKWTIIHDLKREEFEVYGEGEYVGTYPENEEAEMYMAIRRKDAEIQRDKDRLARSAAELPHTSSSVQTRPLKKFILTTMLFLTLTAVVSFALGYGIWWAFSPHPKTFTFDNSDSNNSAANIVWSPDGKYLAAGNMFHTVKIWRVADDVLIDTVDGGSVAWSPDGKTIAVGKPDGSVSIIAPLTNGEIVNSGVSDSHYCISQYENPTIVAWSPQSDYIAESCLKGSAGILYLWQWGSNQWQSYSPPANQVQSISWSPNGQMLVMTFQNVASQNSMMQIVSVNDILRDQPNSLTINNASCAVWSPRGSAIAYDSGNQLVIWDTKTRKPKTTIKEPAGCPAWSPDANRVAAFDGNTVKIWDTQTGNTISTYTGHGFYPGHLINTTGTVIAWSPDGKSIASSDANGSIQVWPAS